MTNAPALDMPSIRSNIHIIEELTGIIQRHVENDLLTPIRDGNIAELNLFDAALIRAHFETIAASVADLKRKLPVSE